MDMKQVDDTRKTHLHSLWLQVEMRHAAFHIWETKHSSGENNIYSVENTAYKQ